uniref:Integrase catalytic domain-containing protein n=1 Tax=Tanacetum cinerariifolium TaxID=118510 RepID=A0A6L2M9T6_TANCI|nr:hypothetical protein [Tanacetum cinerariifolium]
MTTPNITSSTDSQMHNNIMAAGSKDPLRKCILSGPYKPTTVLVQAVDATDDSPAIPEHTTVETPMNMSPKNKAHFVVEKETIHLILTGIGDEIYSTVDACQTAQEMNKNVDTTPRYKNDNHSRQFGNQRTVNVTGARENVGTPVVQQSGIQCFNCKEFRHFAKECRKPKRVKDSAYHKEKMLLCKQAEQGVQLQAEKYDWLADTDEEASILSQWNSNTCLVETDDSNVILESPDMCEDDIQNDQNDVESDDERVALANLIVNLNLDVDENKKIQKQLKKANTTLTQELKECKAILAKTSKSLGESISIRDSCLVALQNKQTEFEKYKAFNDRTIDYDKLKHQFRTPTAKDMEILIQTCLMPLAIKTQNDSFLFVHELKQEMHADLKYVESLEKEIDELEPDKAEFSKMYDMILQECVSQDVMCFYLLSLSDLDALNELQCLYLHKVKECDCLAQNLSNQTESVSKEVHTKLLQSFAKVEKHPISLQIALQKREEQKLIEKGMGKSVDTKFDKLYVVQQPNAQRIPKPSVLGKPAPFSNSLERIYFSMTKSVPKTNLSKGLSKPDTAQTLPQTARQVVSNTNVLKPRMYQINNMSTQTRAPQSPQTVKNTNPRVSTSTGVNHKTNVSIPQHKSNQLKDKVVPNNSQVKLKNTQVEVHPSIPSISHKMKSVTACNENLNSRTSNVNVVCATCNKCLVDSNHFACVTKMLNDVNARTKKPNVVPISIRKPKGQANKSVASPHKKKVASKSKNQKPQSNYRMLYENTNKAWKWWISQKCPSGYKWVPKTKMHRVPKAKNENVQKRIVQPILFIINSGCMKHMTGNLKLLCNFVEKFLGTVHFGNDQFALILGYGDLVQGNVTINRVYYVEGLNHNLFPGNNLLTGNRGSDLYTISLQESTSSTPLYLMDKASPTQAWLWHRRLSHLNFDYINLLSKKDIVIGLPKLKYVKDQLCSSCELSKEKRSSFKSKAVPSSKRRLNLLHMDLCGPMRVASINGKKYILVIVDDYSRYTWTLFLRSKDETSEVLKEFLTMIQRNLQALVIIVRTDRGTEFLNKTLNAFFKEEGIEHQTSIPRTPKQNGTSVANDTSGLGPQQQKASDYDNLDPVPQRQDVSSSTDAHVPSQHELDLLFRPLYGKNNDQVEEYLPDDEFTNPFCEPALEVAESSSHDIGNSNVPTFNQPQVSEYRWTKDHPLEQLRGNPSRPVQTRRQLTTDPKMCTFALTVNAAEPKNIKEAMVDSAWIKAMQEELHHTQVFSNLSDGRKNGISQWSTKGAGLWYPKGSSFGLTAFPDANHAGCIDSRKSTSRGIQFLGDKLVSWMSKKQKCTTMSSAEAEYVSLSASCTQVITKCQLADMFTKALPEDRFKYLVRRIGMRCLTLAEPEVLAKGSA